MPQHLFSAGVSEAVNSIVPLVIAVCGVAIIERIRRRVGALVDVQDDHSRILNPSEFHTKVQIQSTSDCILQLLNGMLRHFAKMNLAIIVVVSIGLTLTLTLSLDKDTQHAGRKVQPYDVDDAVVFGFLSLAAFLVGVLGCVGGLLALYRASCASSTLCALAATEGALEADAEKGFRAVFQTMVEASSSCGGAAVGFALLSALIAVDIGSAQYPFVAAVEGDGGSVAILGGIVASCGLGASLVAVVQSLHGGLIARGFDLNFDRIEAESCQRPNGILLCVGSVIGDMVQTLTALLPAICEGFVGFLVFSTLLVDPIEPTPTFDVASLLASDSSFLRLPLWVGAVALLVSCGVSLAAHRLPAPNGKAIVRRVRLLVITSCVLSLFVVWGCLHGLVPPEGILLTALKPSHNSSADEAAGLLTHVRREDFISMLAMGGVSVIFIVELCEVFSTTQFFFVKNVARSCSIGSPAATLSAMATSNIALLAASVVCVGVVYASYSFCGFVGLSLVAMGGTIPLCSVLSVGFLSPLAKNGRVITEMNSMLPEVIAVAEAFTDRTSVVSAMVSGYISVASFFLSLSTLCAFAVLMSDQGLNFFSTHVIAFAVLGCALANVFSSTYLYGIAESGQEVSGVVEEMIGRATSTRHRNPTPSSLQPEDVSKMAAVSKKVMPYTLGAVATAIAMPSLVGFLFGSEAVIALLLGATVTSFSSTFSSAAFGSTTESLKQWVMKGGLADVARYTQHYSAAARTASVGAGVRSANGPAVIGLLRVMGLVCIVLAPVFRSVSNTPLQ